MVVGRDGSGMGGMNLLLMIHGRSRRIGKRRYLASPSSAICRVIRLQGILRVTRYVRRRLPVIYGVFVGGRGGDEVVRSAIERSTLSTGSGWVLIQLVSILKLRSGSVRLWVLRS